MSKRKEKARDPAAELGTRLVQHLEATHLPVALNALLSAAATNEPPELIAEAMQKKPFKGRVIVSVKLVHTAPVALTEDAAALAESPELIRAALEPLYDAGGPPWPAAKLVSQVATPLKKPFKAALERRIADGTLPPEVAVTLKGKTSALYSTDRPPPPPPRPPVEALAETLVGTLERWKVEGPPAYPTTFQYLMESITPAPDETLLGKALKHKTFKSRVMFANPKNHAAPIALTDDRAALATSRVLLDFMLGAARTAATQAFPAKALVKLIAKPLQTEIVSALNAAGPDAVPPGIGFVVINGTRHFFALSDMNAGTAASPPPEVPAITAPVAAPPESFATAFDHAFAHLDRHTGGINFVNLRDLRQNLPQFDRPEFDARLLELRRERRYTLKAAEGLDGLAHEERAAGIQEDGDLLLNVSRLQP